MRIRKEPDLRCKPPSQIAEYLAQRWQGRSLCANDLRTIYRLDEDMVGATMQALVRIGAAHSPRHTGGEDSITSYRIGAHG